MIEKSLYETYAPRYHTTPGRFTVVRRHENRRSILPVWAGYCSPTCLVRHNWRIIAELCAHSTDIVNKAGLESVAGLPVSSKVESYSPTVPILFPDIELYADIRNEHCPVYHIRAKRQPLFQGKCIDMGLVCHLLRRCRKPGCFRIGKSIVYLLYLILTIFNFISAAKLINISY